MQRRLRELHQDPEAGGSRRGQLIDALNDQPAMHQKMHAQVQAFESEMEHATATLATMRGQLVQMNVDSSGFGEQRLAEQLLDLRAHVGVASETIAEITRGM